jgi:pyruvate dehydrogenase (quinone)
LNKALKTWKKDQEDYIYRAEESDPTLIHPQFMTQTLDRLTTDDAAFTADVGSPMVWLLHHIRATGARSFLTSLLHGAMANAYSQALRIALAFPQRQIIALCGVGGMTMLLGDLHTLVQEQIPIKILVYNNDTLGFVEMEQRVEGLLDAFTSLENPDFSELARVCKMYGRRVENSNDLETAMTEWLAHDGPALLDVCVNSMELVMPPKIEAKQVALTALFGIKAVLNGRMTEVYSLLINNFWR